VLINTKQITLPKTNPEKLHNSCTIYTPTRNTNINFLHQKTKRNNPSTIGTDNRRAAVDPEPWAQVKGMNLAIMSATARSEGGENSASGLPQLQNL